MLDKLRPTPKEWQPKYQWELETDKHVLEVSHIGKDGEKYSTSKEYTPDPNGYSVDINFVLIPGDTKVEVVPYHLQVFSNTVNLQDAEGASYKLFVGVVNESSVAFLGSQYQTLDGEPVGITQYFFENDAPAGCNMSGLQAPTWPLSRPAFITDSMRPYITGLAELNPNVAQSLTTCARLLGAPAEA